MYDIKFTEEQQAALNSKADIIKIVARAGAGKTTLLVGFARKYLRVSILYLAYNSSIRAEAKEKMPPNVDVHTAHSLAYEHIGKFYKDKLVDNTKPMDIINNLEVFKKAYKANPGDYRIFKTAIDVKEVLERFFYSTAEEIILDSKIGDFAREYWAKMQNLADPTPMVQDGYLKLFQISKPQLNYGIIMVDEAQDLNSAIKDLVDMQEATKVFVGDPFQSIYGYKNTINVFKEKKGEFFYLTKSFRFGQSLASLASNFLSFYKRGNFKVRGNEKINTRIGYVDKTLPFVTITRTNAKIFELAYEAVKKNQSIFIYGGKDAIFKELLSGYYLFKNQKENIKDPFLKSMRSWKDFVELSEITKDPEYTYLVKIIEKYMDDLPYMLKLIDSKIVGKEMHAKKTFVTAHKSKGLEFFNVMLADDFISLTDKKKNPLPPHKVEQEEINILYVALTRAQDYLELSPYLYKIFTQFEII
jgi:superfamily I DNA/RNA helicase